MGDEELEVLTIGRVSVDLYAKQQRVSMSEVTSFEKSIGGTSTNVAVAAARLGHRAATYTRVGDDQFGRYVKHALEHTFGVDIRFVQTAIKAPFRDVPVEPVIIESVTIVED